MTQPIPVPERYAAPWNTLQNILLRQPDITYAQLRQDDPTLDLLALMPILSDRVTRAMGADTSAFEDHLSLAVAARWQLLRLEKNPNAMKSASLDTESVRQLAQTEWEDACRDCPPGFALIASCSADTSYALRGNGKDAADTIGDLGLDSPLPSGRAFSTANMAKLTQFSMQTDAVSRNLTHLLPEENEVLVGYTSGKKGRQEVSTVVTLDFPTELQLGSGQYLSSYDKTILNGVSSMILAGNTYFTIPMLYHAMTGVQNPSLDAGTAAMLRERLDFMRRSTISIDYTDEAAARLIGSKVDRYVIENYLLPMNRIDAVVNGHAVEAWHVIARPPLFDYASRKKQLAVVRLELLNAPLNNTTTTIPLKNYILSRIEGMKNRHNRIVSNKILFSSLFEELGETEPTKLRRKRIRDYTETFLSYLVEADYIADYAFTKNGRTIDGVAIYLSDSTVALAPAAPDAAAPRTDGKIRPVKKRANRIKDSE